MSDQGKWFKLWEAALDDADLENLDIHQWYCWARFGVYLKKHGNDGKITLRNPCTALVNLFRLHSFEEVIKMLKMFPNYLIKEDIIETVNVTNVVVSCFVVCKNWNKYQGDFSTDRVRKHRLRVTANVTPQEERRREETLKSTSTSTSTPRASQSARLGALPPRLPATREEIDVELLEQGEANKVWRQSTNKNLIKSDPKIATPEEVSQILSKWRTLNPRGGKH